MLTAKNSYSDIKKTVLARIRDHTWPPGSIIPGEVELSEEFGCARATVNRAMRELAEDGILDRKRKAGTRVNKFPIRHAKFAIPLIRTEITSTGAAYRYTLI
ncbi:MAG: GntR family transcriptional regulator, partial [Proteobacteria bacterium]|nr:GntR family transcriptional regulator [Pseudomonadota bacterium]